MAKAADLNLDELATSVTVFWNGPVVRVIAGLEKAFNEQQ